MPVLGFVGLYEVSNLGRVRSLSRTRMQQGPRGGIIRVAYKGRVICQNSTPDGYKVVHLSDCRRRKLLKVHRLVLSSFLRPPLPNEQCCHCDGNRVNNNLQNLRWDTSAGNYSDRIAHGTSARGERNGRARLTLQDVRDIRQMSNEGLTQGELAKRFGVNQPAISKIILGKTWATNG
jgi:hypothetical protein